MKNKDKYDFSIFKASKRIQYPDVVVTFTAADGTSLEFRGQTHLEVYKSILR